MARFFLEPEGWSGSPALSGEEAKHCARVMRLGPGERIEVFDGEGRSADAELREVARDRVSLELGPARHEAPPAVPVTLAPAVLKGRAMEWLVQKAVELGAGELRPVHAEHGVARAEPGKEAKWRRVALEACKQCGRNRLPRLAPAVPLGEFLEQQHEGVRVVASLAGGARPLREVLAGRPEGVTALIGPEGDWSAAELAAVEAAGWAPVRLGEPVLRSETAGIALLAACVVAFG